MKKVHEDLLTLMPETNLDFIIDLGFFWKHDHQTKSKTFLWTVNQSVWWKKVDIEYMKNWWCKVGILFLHIPKAFRSGILHDRKSIYIFLQLGEKFDTLCLSHTHHQGFSRYGKVYMYESGCLCEEPILCFWGTMIRPQDKGLSI